MKKVTLSIPENLLAKSKAYAAQRGMTLNELIRTLLSKRVVGETQNPIEKLIEHEKATPIQTNNWRLNRDEMYT